MKTKTKITLLLSILLMLSFVIYNAIYINPSSLKVRLETIQSAKIQASFDDFTIAFFSDVHYDRNHNSQFEKALLAISEADVDMILFGGDLCDRLVNETLNDDDHYYLSQKLKDLDAPFGKYAVLGNHDLKNESVKENIQKILINADFRILNNEMIKIYNENQDFIQLIGIDSMVLGNPDILKAFETQEENYYTITLCHTPDLFDHFKARSDYALAGHSHGGQIFFPFITSFITPDGAKEYIRGKHKSEDAILDITSGVGTTIKDIRLNADAEIVIYRLKAY